MPELRILGLLAFVVVLLISCDSVTSPSTATLEGTVLSDEGDGVSGIAVTLDPDGSDADVTITEASGTYRFLDVSPGEYTLSIEVPPEKIARDPTRRVLVPEDGWTHDFTLGSIVEIPEENLKGAIRETLNLPEGPVSSIDLLRLYELTAEELGIVRLTGLEYARVLRVLEMDANEIHDLSPLEDLTELRRLRLTENQIQDLSSLEGLTGLQQLYASGNEIEDISSLGSLSSLTRLWLSENEIEDISPLEGLAELEAVSLSGNEINDISSLEGLSGLATAAFSDNHIEEISPLEGLVELERLHGHSNEIADISGLENLHNLKYVYLERNEIHDLSPLQNLTELEYLALPHNEVRDISPLEGLTGLRYVSLSGNQIENLGPLVDNDGFGAGAGLSVSRNPLSPKACEEHIPTLEARGVDVSAGNAC